MFRFANIDDWRRTTLHFPNAIIASRVGNIAELGRPEENGKNLLEMRLSYCGPDGGPIPEGDGYIEPYRTETKHIDILYLNRRKNWLYQLPENLDSMEKVKLEGLVSIANEEMRSSVVSPLISLRGKWYFATGLHFDGSRLSTFENSRVMLFKEDASGDTLAQVKKESGQGSEGGRFFRIALNSISESDFFAYFPEDVQRYLLYVSPEARDFDQFRPTISITNGKEEGVYMILSEPFKGAIEVVRKKDRMLI